MKKFYIKLLMSFLIIMNISNNSFAQTSSSFSTSEKSSSFDSKSATIIKNQSETQSFTKIANKDDIVPEGKLDNTIDVGAPGVKKIRIAIPTFVLEDKNISLSSQELNLFTKRIQNLFAFTNWFEFIPQAAFTAPNNAALFPFQSSQWTSLKAEYVLFGKFTASTNAGRFNLEFRLFDVKSQNQVIGKLYTNLSSKSTDIALRRFGDVTLGALTGTPGPFMSQIVFVGKKQLNANGQIYVADFDGGNLKQITTNNSVNLSPTWTADGTKITYTSFKSGKPEIYNYNLITKRETKLVSNMQNSSGASWSPDGNTVAFSATSQDEKSTHIFTIDKFGRNKKTLIDTSSIEVEPSFSPNGKLLAYTSTKFGKPMIFIKDLGNDTNTRITYAGWYNASASWTPDSKTLAFASYDRDIDRWDLFRIDATGSNIERLTLNQGDNEKPTWSPDGRFILFQSDRNPNGSRNGPKKLYIMTKDGSYQKSLDIPLVEAKQASWGPRITELEEE
ncbi:DPP IV N-terminal domain-containing protein [Silvanigrella aquatica]|nr:DPP IV N-terminal domain-containing protein [Silvanigrella aquatica]